MKFTNCRNLIPVAVLCLGLNATAQTDSTQLDLGRLKMKKAFTQNITIKGSDLTHMPFTSLEEAIAAWTYGAYTNRDAFTWVVDGNPVTDIQAISIFEIEEIVVVQNAAVQVHGADNRKQLVLVTTKRKPGGAKGIQVATQSFLVSRDYEKIAAGAKGSSTNVYHQYHAAVNSSSGPLEYGISANYLRDITPKGKGNYKNYFEEPQLDRFRLNGWVSAKLGKQHQLHVQANYAPQNYQSETDPASATNNVKIDRTEREISARIQLQSQLGKKWRNDLSASYFHGRDKLEGTTYRIILVTPGAPPGRMDQLSERQNKARLLVFRENLTFSQQWGNFTLEPSVDFTARFHKSKLTAVLAESIDGTPAGYNWSEVNMKEEQYLLTPAVNLFYKNAINLQAGALFNLSDFNGASAPREYPFVSVSADIARLITPTGSTSIKVFGSYTKADYFTYRTPSLSDLQSPDYTQSYFGPSSPGIVPGLNPQDDDFWIWEIGATVGLLNGRIEAGYNYEKRDFNEAMQVFLPVSSWPGTYTIFPDMRSSAHHIRLTGRIAATDRFRWTSGITATSSNVEIIRLNAQNLPSPPIINSGKPIKSWTGGWVNQLRYKKFLAGIVCMYYFNEPQLNQNGASFTTSKENTILLQQLYAGYVLKAPKLKEVEIYASARNLAASKKSTMTDYRKFYGLGLNVQL